MGVSMAEARGRRIRAAGRDQILLISCDDLFDLFYFRSRTAPSGGPLFGVPIRASCILNLATQGVRFSEAHCASPICNPSRAALICGRNPIKTGVHNNTTPWHEAFDLHSTLPGLLNANGYRCSMFGKVTHGGSLAGPTGNRIWRDEGICEVVNGAAPNEGETHDQAITRNATGYITGSLTQLDKFCMMVGYTGTHMPGPDRPDVLGLFPLDQIIVPEWDGDPPPVCMGELHEWPTLPELHKKTLIQAYLADLYAMDREIDRLLTSVRNAGLDPTIILTSDHGFSFGDHGRPGKFTLWNEATRVPLLLKYPGCPAGMVVSEAVSTLDIMPTLLHHAAIPRPSYLDGWSLLPRVINGEPIDSGAMMTRNDDVSLVYDGYRITRYAPCDASGGQYEWELYDQNLDPTSTTNLWDEPGLAAIQAGMLAKFNAKLALWST